MTIGLFEDQHPGSIEALFDELGSIDHLVVPAAQVRRGILGPERSTPRV